jgi:protein-disulfide isomerase
MIASHNAFTASSAYNEVILANWGGTPDVVPANEKYRLWTVAYFYDPSKPNGRAIAQSFQRKMAATGKHVAILQLNFTAPSAQRFQFQQADQVAGLYP